nr:PEP-CTERM sorting domain-containing protein [Colwellia sp.]
NANLLSSNYITVNHDNHLVDWAWASMVSVQYDTDGSFKLDVNGDLSFDQNGNPELKDDSDIYNEFYAPEHVEGWRVATEQEFNFFKSNILIDDFIDDDDNYIVATSFWNSLYTESNDISIDAFHIEDIYNGTGYKTSSWVEGSFNKDNDQSYYDTFYVRTHNSEPQPVPEPSTLMIFALGLIALASKKSIIFCTKK